MARQWQRISESWRKRRGMAAAALISAGWRACGSGYVSVSWRTINTAAAWLASSGGGGIINNRAINNQQILMAALSARRNLSQYRQPAAWRGGSMAAYGAGGNRGVSVSSSLSEKRDNAMAAC